MGYTQLVEYCQVVQPPRKFKGGICYGGHFAITYGGELLYLWIFSYPSNYGPVKHVATLIWADHVEWSYNNSYVRDRQNGHCRIALHRGQKRDRIPPLKFLGNLRQSSSTIPSNCSTNNLPGLPSFSQTLYCSLHDYSKSMSLPYKDAIFPNSFSITRSESGDQMLVYHVVTVNL